MQCDRNITQHLWPFSRARDSPLRLAPAPTNLQAQRRIQSTVIPALLVLCGGLALRFFLVAAGQATNWAAVLD